MSDFFDSDACKRIADHVCRLQTRLPTPRPKSWFMFYTSAAWLQVAQGFKKPLFGNSTPLQWGKVPVGWEHLSGPVLSGYPNPDSINSRICDPRIRKPSARHKVPSYGKPIGVRGSNLMQNGLRDLTKLYKLRDFPQQNNVADSFATAKRPDSATEP